MDNATLYTRQASMALCKSVVQATVHMSIAANDNNEPRPVLRMHRACAYWLGAKSMPFGPDGKPLPLIPARLCLIILASDPYGEELMYWPVLEGAQTNA